MSATNEFAVTFMQVILDIHQCITRVSSRILHNNMTNMTAEAAKSYNGKRLSAVVTRNHK